MLPVADPDLQEEARLTMNIEFYHAACRKHFERTSLETSHHRLPPWWLNWETDFREVKFVPRTQLFLKVLFLVTEQQFSSAAHVSRG